MDIHVHTDGGIDAALDLAHWIAADPGVPPEASPVPAAPAPGSMSATTDVLQFAVGNAIALGALLVSVAQWRQSRPVRPTVRLTAVRPDGASVTVESDDPATLAAAVRELGGT
ncbi:hypothetical protein GCM10010124_20550 [Pilimelia terevasa]|uniref:Uncharacterized protein n=1 Tax=Pilimelia terevasa TaxID=53372 RepID=A0A8J3FKE2_9ACTN|nr:hypothetical protein [Pilimelia terevasa]GGK27860.1 hypothetical protein GCM10010124_20550 [Pilimelia terevasa]